MITVRVRAGVLLLAGVLLGWTCPARAADLSGQLDLYRRTAADVRVAGKPSGRISFVLGSAELTFRARASGLRADESYSLIFFPEAGGRAVPVILGSAITNRRGSLAIRGAASVSVALLGGKTPTEFFYAFTPWLVPDSDLDIEAPVRRFTAWNPDDYLFPERPTSRRSPEVPPLLVLDTLLPAFFPALKDGNVGGVACLQNCDLENEVCVARCDLTHATEILKEVTCTQSCNAWCAGLGIDCDACVADCVGLSPPSTECYAACATQNAACLDDCPAGEE